MKTLAILLLILSSSPALSQNPDSVRPAPPDDSGDSSRVIGHVYHVNAWGSLALSVGGELANLVVQRTFSKPEITNAEFDAAQQASSENAINPLDRWVLHSTASTVDYTWTAVGIQAACAAAPLGLFFGEQFRKNWDDIILMALEVNMLATAMFQISPFGPVFQNRYRPAVYFAKDSTSRFNERNGGERNSFFSGHECSAAVSLFYTAKVYCDYHPEIHGLDKIGIYALASIPPLVMGYFRVIALRHFPTDVIAGGIIGGVIGIVVPELHRIPNKKVDIGMYSSPQSTGATLTWKIN
jgi:hypothetical protein